MRSRLWVCALLMGLMGLGTGASVEGVHQAEEWQQAGDLALHNDSLAIGSVYYTKVIETFPGTPHSKMAAWRGDYCQYRLRHPNHIPPGENWWAELYDTLTW